MVARCFTSARNVKIISNENILQWSHKDVHKIALS